MVHYKRKKKGTDLEWYLQVYFIPNMKHVPQVSFTYVLRGRRVISGSCFTMKHISQKDILNKLGIHQ